MADHEPSWDELGTRAVAHLKSLLRLDTTNPPGNERLVADYVAAELRRIGLEPKVVARTPGRDNVVVRIKGEEGGGKPLLLASHADVVAAEASRWTHPPFGGEEADGCLWGRGALDMKCGTAMHLAALEEIVAAGRPPHRDVIMAVVADEEAGMEDGSRFLVDEHPDLVRAEYALGEVGGFTMNVMGKKIIPVQVAEKGICWLKATARGEPGHGSIPNEHSAVVTLSKAVARIGSKRLPVHVTPPALAYLKGLAQALPGAGRAAMTMLQDERTAGPVLDMALRKPEIRRPLLAALTNTASPTVLRAGDKVNIIPGRAEALIDGRTLPGQGPGDLVRELKKLTPQLDFEVISAEASASASHETVVFEVIRAALGRHQPDGAVVPMLLPGYTDAKSWSRLGAQCYGFMPLALPADFPPIFELIHGHDERVPIESLREGAVVFYEVVAELCGLWSPARA